jgi:hypothetical protein
MADVPLTVFPKDPRASAANSNSSQRLNCSSLTNSPTNSSLHCTALTELGRQRDIASERTTYKTPPPTLCLSLRAGRCPATKVVSLLASRPLSSNGSICHNIINKILKRLLHNVIWKIAKDILEKYELFKEPHINFNKRNTMGLISLWLYKESKLRD